MGIRMSPYYAIISSGSLEYFLNSHYLKASFTEIHLRYFKCLDPQKGTSFRFYHNFNNFHPNINLILYHFTEQVLPLCHCKSTQQTHKHHVKGKPTYCHIYLDVSSLHPDILPNLLPIARQHYCCICSDLFDRDVELMELSQAFRRLNNPPTRSIDKSIEPDQFPGRTY